MQLPCEHVICGKCLNSLEVHHPGGTNCPLCRASGPATSGQLYVDYLQLMTRAQRLVSQAQDELYLQAFQFLETAIETYPDDVELLSVHAKGEGVPINQERAFELWNQIATTGDSNAQCNVARCYADGEGTDQDNPRAFEWFSAAAKGGDVHAQYALGSMYDNGVVRSCARGRHGRWICLSSNLNVEERAAADHHVHKYGSPSRLSVAGLCGCSDIRRWHEVTQRPTCR